MFQQNVKNVSYMAKAVLKFDELEQEYKAIVLPRGAEISQVSLEVTSANNDGATLNVGLNDEKDFFMQNLDLSKVDNFASSKITATKEASFVSVNFSVADLKDGEAVLRVVYFLPSEIMTEF